MSVSVPIELGYEFSVKAPFEEVFGVLADVPESVSHFPKVERLVDMKRGVYRWEMEPVGTAQVHIQTVYASRYVSDARKGTVVWTPVADVGNAQVAGSWTVKRRKAPAAKAATKAGAKAGTKPPAKAANAGTDLKLEIHGIVNVQMPTITRLVVEPVVQVEFEQLVDGYIANLIERFGGEI